MAKGPNKNATEIVSLNRELISFDLNDISAEKLEQRLELALAALFFDSSCGSFSCGSFGCGTYTCDTFHSPILQPGT
jgi:hypothetical protein